MSQLPILGFSSVKRWESWLAKHHATQTEGIWLQFFKKDSDVKTINHDEALDEALCYGWIDGQLKKHDDQSWIQKFTPRRGKSIWSKRNIDSVERLIKARKMKAAGMLAVEAAKADGRWQQAYDSPSNMVIPDDFLKALGKDKKAKAFFETLNKANLYAIAWRLQTAKKPETRESRMRKILEMMTNKEKFHS